MKIHEIISDKLPHPTILKTSTCSASKIYPNVTLLGGIKSGNFTSLGKTKNMQECIGKTCELGRGDLAFMLGSYCYSVSCSSGRVCQTIPAQPSKFYPRIAFLKWAPKINETGKMNIVVIYTYFFSSALGGGILERDWVQSGDAYIVRSAQKISFSIIAWHETMANFYTKSYFEVAHDRDK